jgi:tRNA pseudouridine55 synthase
MATGLLVIAVDRSTKLLGHLALTDKTYLATIRLGIATTTDDAEGELLPGPDPGSPIAVSDAAIAGRIAALTGELMQVPSSVSAIKVDGKRSYARVRAGEQVQLAARPVTVSRFDLLTPPSRGTTDGGRPVIDLEVAVECSTGTYIRALARDLGDALGVGGHLTALRRTRVGPFEIAGAVDVFGSAVPGVRTAGPVHEALTQRVAGAVIPAADAARIAFGVRTATEAEQRDLSYGRPLDAVGIGGTYAVLDPTGTRLLALLAESDGKAKPRLVFEAH